MKHLAIAFVVAVWGCGKPDRAASHDAAPRRHRTVDSGPTPDLPDRPSTAPRPPAVATIDKIPRPTMAPQPPEPTDCGGYTYYRDDRPCCAGLTRIAGKLQQDGSCDPDDGLNIGEGPFCSPCGDGVCQWAEDRCNCPSDCMPGARQPTITYDGGHRAPNMTPSILYLPVDGDMPALADKLLDAWMTADASVCDALPEPARRTFDEGDYTINSPPREAWYRYCRVLAANAPTSCQAIESHDQPNLQESCIQFFRSVAAVVDDSPAACVAASTDIEEIHNCMYGTFNATFGPRRLAIETDVAASLGPFTREEVQLYHCAELAWGKPRDACLEALVSAGADQRLCQLTSTRRCSPTSE